MTREREAARPPARADARRDREGSILMKARTIRTRAAAAILLSLLSAAGGPPARAQAVAEAGVAAASEQERDEREARELAVEFVSRLKETGESGPLVSEFFADDFAERFRLYVESEPELGGELSAFIEPQVFAQATAADLRRLYVAMLDFWTQHDRAGDYERTLARDARPGAHPAPEAGHDGGNRQGGRQGGGLTLRETLPRDFIRADDDPLIAAIKVGFFGEEKGGGEGEAAGGSEGGKGEGGGAGEDDGEAAEARAKAAAIRTVARLRTFTLELEAFVGQMRRGVERLRAEAEARAQAAGVAAGAEAARAAVRAAVGESVYRVESEESEREAFGLPAGARIVRVMMWPYVVVVAQVGGRPRILCVLPDADGD